MRAGPVFRSPTLPISKMRTWELFSETTRQDNNIAMTSLYKRYIPPKSAAPPSVAPANVPQPIVAPQPPKRKRERSEEEVAERKAKKAKKKGVPVENLGKTDGEKRKDPAQSVKASAPLQVVPRVPPEPAVVEVESVPPEEVLEAGTVPLPDVDAVEEAVATGDFSHVKNKKKRHKLEKEARKARKAAEKSGGGDGEPEAEAAVEGATASFKASGTAIDDILEGVSVAEVEEPAETAEVENDKVEADAEGQPAEVEVTVKVKDKDKTRKPKKKEQNPVEEAPKETPPIPPTPEYDEAGSRPKKRRHKLEAALAETLPQTDGGEQKVDSEANDDDDAHLRKHGAILNNFQKASKRSQALQQSQPKEQDAEADQEVLKESLQPVVEDLEMPDADLPAPTEGEDGDGDEEISSNLPPWLAKPTIVSTDSKATFASLKLAPKTLAHLSALKFEDALPVQQALIPLLLPPGTAGSSYLPGTELILPDLAVSAATGSGKTLAYLLPIIESLKSNCIRGRLTALIVVPTRELVLQVAAVAESLAKGTGLKVGMATGGGKFADEQKKVMRRWFRYSPASASATAEEELGAAEDTSEDILYCPPHHRIIRDSALDILVATPGRLLEHLEHTKGFNLVHLQWLVLDEADKLLDHQSARDISSLLQHISRPRAVIEQDARERYLRREAEWDESMERRVRKVLLSATMTRDIQRLTGLGLRFPKLIAVQQEAEERKSGFEVPEGLREYVVPVGDGSEKPLIALEWLRTRVFGEKEDGAENSDSSDSDSDTDTDTDTDSNGESELDSPSSSSTVDHEDHAGHSAPPTPKKTSPTVLVFTATSEAASRLSHLLRALKPEWEQNISLLTKSQKSLPRNSSSSSPFIIVSTDRAARGLDSLAGRPISHVLQYDVPTSLTNYVHRVGRTARNGREGEAWTLFARREAAWFLKVVGVEQGGEGERVKRKGLVERIKVFMKDDRVRERYTEVLGEMRGEVLGSGKAE